MARQFVLTAGLAAAAAGLAACSAPPQEEAAAAPETTMIETPAGMVVPYTQALHDNPPYKTLHDTLWLMENVVQPTADVFWGSAGYVIDKDGEHSLLPTTDEAWANVVSHSATLAELGNLLMTPPFSEGRGDDWFQFAGSLADIGMRAQAAAEARSEEEIFEVGAIMDRVCEGCHINYQDPNAIYAPIGLPDAAAAAADANNLPNPADAADTDMDAERPAQ